ncbi:putative diguanylate cyclase [Gottschalkia acidurici 9a]|uniref:Diguanylate cyclase n=1 Tax=Gottschalkia acidurici (strain ATCC 7906 / DSM 604 / BCRC 14475 / CIP 104303 / KCTC 5404 / NCIMB 10678 / 9a) TaxID=1128398 RepID=K0B0Y8_GOTA9|nr:GGDEF domain-containing protein [Gottschalkia acidurici]AFS79184.1 putative diguanylate cyclase [Gottschalkia acidurici 9a]
MSYHDTLTGLFNRAYFEKEVKRLNNVINTKIGILVCDLDNLKEINDELGHKRGDQLIKESGKIIEKSFKRCSVFRIGGDEFSVILDNLGCREVEAKISNLKSQINRYNKSEPKIPIKISIGFSYSEHSLGQVSKVFKEADRNMYKDKLNNKIV